MPALHERVRLPFRIPIAAIAGAAVTLAVFGLAARSHVSGFQCRSTPLAEVVAPDGTQRAVSFVRDCGRRTQRSTQLSLLLPDEPLGNRFGNIFVAELEREAEIQMLWAAADVLEIRVGKIRRAYRADPGKGRVRVLYGRLP